MDKYVRKPNPIANIDTILGFFQPNENNKNGVQYFEIENFRNSDNWSIYDISDRQLLEIVYKLLEDRYLRIEKREVLITGVGKSQVVVNEYYLLTFTGELFLLRGGYYGEFRKNVRVRKVLRLERTLLTGGTMAAGAYGLFEIGKFLYHHTLFFHSLLSILSRYYS